MFTSIVALVIICVMLVEGVIILVLYISKAQDRRSAYNRAQSIINSISEITHVLGKEPCKFCGFKHQPFPLTHVQKGDLVFFGWDTWRRKVTDIAVRSSSEDECKTWVTLKGFKQKQFPVTCINR